MAPIRPSQTDIETLVGITGGSIGAAQAELLLNKYNSLDNAANEYFNDADKALQPVSVQPPVPTWGDMDNVPGFRIEGEDTVDSSVHGAVSRPNSRVSNARDHPIDLTTDNPSAYATNMSLAEREEEQMRRAMALSVGEEIPAQESGVTGAGQQFGVASDAHYDPNKWAMTTTHATTREVIEHPPPSRRRRVDEHPAFLRGSEATGYLGPLLTILHSIPLAREALLMPSFKVLSYGFDPKWWSGTSDENTKAVSVETSAEINADISNIICEMQSLMAFLDGTHRAYGSVDALADLNAFRTFPAETQCSRMLEVWKASAMTHNPDDQLTQIFTSVALKNTYPASDMPATKIFSCLEPPVGDHDGNSLYDLLDNAVWNDNIDLHLDDVWINNIAEVFTMRLYRHIADGQGVGIRVPAEWYPDRYLDECRTKAWEMRMKKQAIAQRIRQIEAKKHYITSLPARDARGSLDILSTLALGADATRIMAKNKLAPNGLHGDMEPLLAADTGVTKAQTEEVEAEIRNMIVRINRKLTILDERKREAENMYHEMTRQMTKESRDVDGGPTHKYMLQGVSTKPHITYVRLPPKRDLVDLDDHDDGGETKEKSWLWWRMSFSRDDANPTSNNYDNEPISGAATQPSSHLTVNGHGNGNNISDWSRKVQLASTNAHAQSTHGYTVRQVREYEVLKAAREEYHSVLLIYANANSLRFTGSEPSDALKEFVVNDNRSFERDLEAEMTRGMRDTGGEDNEDPFVDVPTDGNIGMASPPLTPPPAESNSTQASAGSSPEPGTGKKTRSASSNGSSGDEDDPPPYAVHAVSAAGTKQEMVESGRNGSMGMFSSPPPAAAQGSKIRMHAEKMLERVVDQPDKEKENEGDEGGEDEDEDEEEKMHAL